VPKPSFKVVSLIFTHFADIFPELTASAIRTTMAFLGTFWIHRMLSHPWIGNVKCITQLILHNYSMAVFMAQVARAQNPQSSNVSFSQRRADSLRTGSSLRDLLDEVTEDRTIIKYNNLEATIAQSSLT
jgi:hypothetical protein